MGTAAAGNYVLGASDPEVARLDFQAAWLEGPTRLLLREAGVGPGMRVLDLGTGLGHVALAAAELVGAEGEVVGIDSSPKLLQLAGERGAAFPQVRFQEGDVRSWRGEEPFDAVVGRLILFHLPDAAAVLQHHLQGLRPGGLMVALDYDLGAIRTEPPVPLVAEHAAWMLAAFRSAKADPMIGARLAPLFSRVGLAGVRTLGIQGYLGPTDPRGPAMLAGVVRSLAPQMVAAGIATAEQLGLDTLAERLAAAVQEAGAVFVPPVLAGAWGRWSS
jgi:ubiquinone/menaquinone biosynthesis C-methylase UbiE